MRTWIDNTGLHSTGNCLAGTATTDYDVRGLLQFATLLIFSEKIELNGFESKSVQEQSVLFRENVLACGVAKEDLTIRDVTQKSYGDACTSAANSMAESLPIEFQTDMEQVLGLAPTSLPRGSLERMVGFVQYSADRHSKDPDELRAQFLGDDAAAGAVDFMMATSSELRRAVGELVQRSKRWSDRDSYHLNARLRFALNQELATRSAALYAPAVGRAELVKREREHVIARLEALMAEAVAEFLPARLGLPSVAACLVDRSAGAADGVLKAALELRPKAAPLRADLASFSGASSGEQRKEIRKRIEDLGDLLRMDLGLKPAPKLVDAIDIQAVIGLPPVTVSVSGRKLLEWYRYMIGKRRVAVLTDVVNSVIEDSAIEAKFAKLKMSCFRQSR